MNKLEFTSAEEELAYYERALELLPLYPTPLMEHAISLVRTRIRELKEKI